MTITRTALGLAAAATLTLTSGAATSAAQLADTAPAKASSSDELLEVSGGEYIVMLELPEQAQGTKALGNATAQAAVERATEKQAAKWAAKGVKVRQEFKNLGGFAADLTAAQVKALKADPSVAIVEKNQTVTAAGTQSNAPWGLDRVDQDDMPLNGTYNYSHTGAGATAYVLDTGINASHVDFSGRVQPGKTVINDGNGTHDCAGHGTHVAGTIGGETYGVAKDVSLVPIRVLGCDGRGSTAGVIAAMDWVADNHVANSVANMSLGGPASSTQDEAVARMTSSGITVVAAAGNDTADACTASPARAASAITVGSTDKNDALSWFSNFGSCVDILAPGSDIVSASNTSNTGTKTMSGTSMAAPHVAGAVALYLQKNPNASVSQVTNALKSTATPNTITGVSGSPNLMLDTVALTGGTTPTPDPDPTPVPGTGIVNGGFENGTTGWAGDTWTINNQDFAAATGSYKLYLNGYGSQSSEAVHQDLTVPAGATTLSYKLRIVTQETSSYSAYDRMSIRVLGQDGSYLGTLDTFSNLDASSSYVSKTADISKYAGQAIRLQFSGIEDSSSATAFLVDDVAVR